MKQKWLLAIAVGMIAPAAVARTTMAQNVSPCGETSTCATVALTAPSDTKKPGDMVTVGLQFNQGPATGGSGGLGNIAALALTVQEQGGGTATPLTLADCSFACVGGIHAGAACTTDTDCSACVGGANDGNPCTTNKDCQAPGQCMSNQCMVNGVHPDASLSGFTVVVENASCAGGRTHCLCPNPGQTADNFINLVVYGPNPLPPPGTGVQIPPLPSSGASGQLLTIALNVDPAASSNVTLHIQNQTDTSAPPQYTALLSIGDTVAVDQTCTPLAVKGTPPCAAASSTSQVAFTDATVPIAAPTCLAGQTICGATASVPCQCVDDCEMTGSPFGSDVTKAVNILAGNTDISTCPNAEADTVCDGTVFGNMVTLGVLNVANGCPGM